MAIFNLIGPIVTILSRLFPDKSEEMRTQAALEIAHLDQITDLAKSQLAVNEVEAGSEDPYVSRWRPTAGWLCLSALAIGVVVKIILPSLIILLPVCGYTDLATIKMVLAQLAGLDIDFFNTMLWGLLGLGGFRTIEKMSKNKRG